MSSVVGWGKWWCDAVCIDKTSSAELSEAINSMYRWYSRARVCYVYLDDFDLDTDVVSGPEGIAKCRWWTRGWCLQELLAPAEVRFYDCKGQTIGSKRTLRGLISEITRIDKSVLKQPSRLHTLPIAQRMSRASARQTTRIEDIAYSLLGIFDVQMPMLYGEGEKAFIRLQEEIIKRSNDLSISAWKGDTHPGIYQDMFAPLPSYFSDCHNIADDGPGGRMGSGHLFSITNRGVQFAPDNILYCSTSVSQEDSYYVLPLKCFFSRGGNCYWKVLYPRKIGHGLLVRIHDPEGADMFPPQFRRLVLPERDVYIVPKITTDLADSIKVSHRSSFEIMKFLPPARMPSYFIAEVEPREAWDVARLRLLTLGDTSFVGDISFAGYLKFCPPGSSKRGSEFFIMALGFRSPDKTTTIPFVCLIQQSLWQQYDAFTKHLALFLPTLIKEQTQMHPALDPDLSELILGSGKISARVQTRTILWIPIHQVVVDWKGHAEAGCEHPAVSDQRTS